MTGFGVGTAALGQGSVAVEVRAVNGRFLDVRVRLPQELSDLTATVEGEARKRLSRGRCDIVIRSEGNFILAPQVDKERARRAYRALLELRDEIHLDAAKSAILDALGSALEDLSLMRQKEGDAIFVDLAGRLAQVRSLIEKVGARAPEVAEIMAKKFRERLGRLGAVVSSTAGSVGDTAREVAIDPARVEQELVLLVERSDIAEELTRLASHVAQMTAYMQEDEPLGRRLDFLLQEMAREINTIGAKSQDLRTSHAVVELKAEIERMREQVQNVE